MKKLFIFLLISVFLFSLSFVNANLGTYAQNECVNIRTLSNNSAINISTISVGSNTSVLDAPMDNLVGQTFNYTYCNTTALGQYAYDWYPCDDLSCVNTFNITPTGEEFTTFNAVLYSVLLALFLIFLFYCIYGVVTSSNLAWRLVFASSSYFLLLSVVFLSNEIASNFLYSLGFISDILDIALIILIAGILPFVLLMLSYLLYQIVNEKRMKRMMDMGYSREAAEKKIYKRR